MKTKNNKKFKVLSLFSGCGGTDLGFLGGFKYLGKKYNERNFEIIWANDIDESSCITYEKNFGHMSLCADIRDILEEKTLFNDSRLPNNVDIVLGGFPCQDFSLSGKRKGFNSKRLSRGIIPAHPTLFLRKCVYQKFGLFDTSYKIAGDFDFIARVFRGNKINFYYLPEVMVRMQMGGVSTRGLWSLMTSLEENLRSCRKYGIQTNYLKLISRYPGKLLEYLRLG